MIIVVSPAKTLDFSSWDNKQQSTQAVFLKETAKLAQEMQKLSPKQLGKMMKISDKLAELNHQRFQDFQPKHSEKNSKPALLTFNGDVYRDIEADKYSKQQWEYAQKHLRILSGFYGLLRPLDLIQAHRLEMHHKSDFWQPLVTPEIQKQLEQDDRTLINLASKEYFSAINPKKLQDINIITPHFKEKKDNKYRTIAIYSKLARGTMSNFIIKNQLKNPEQIKEFQEDGYKFNSGLSSEKDWIFTR